MRNLQKTLGLPIPDKGSRCSVNYFHFIQKIIILRTFSISLDKIADLFAKEQSILRLLKIDALCSSQIWYLDQCDNTVHLDCQLLLTGYNVGFPISGGSIQTNLDFGHRDPELFNSKEMGEDIQRVLDEYLKLLAAIKSRVIHENPALQQALDWAKTVFNHGQSPV